MSLENPSTTEPFQLLREGPYFRAWLTGTFINTMRWLEMLAVGIYVFEKTSSPLLVAVVLFCRLMPMILFGAAIGALAERANKKHVMLYGLALVTVVSATLGTLLITDRAELWHLALGGFLNGILAAMDYPIRRNIMGEVCGHDRVGAGMALDGTTNSVTKMLGPILGGVLLETIGLEGAFFLGAILHILAMLSLSGLPYAPEKNEPTQQSFIDQITEGVQYIRTNRVIMALLAITVVINLLALPFSSMIPVIGKAELNLTPFLIGLLAASEGAGSLVGCFLIALLRTQRFTQVFLFGSVAFLVFLLLFSWSSWYELALVFLFVAGLGHAGFSIGQSTLIFTQPAPEVRGRVMGMLSMCIGLQPLGVLNVGLMADYFGGSIAITVMTVEGLIAIGVCWLIWPEMRRHK
jgi:MFS family permease